MTTTDAPETVAASARTGIRPPGRDWHLLARLDIVEDRVRRVVAEQRVGDPDPDDRFRGLYVSDAQVDTMLAGAPPSESTQPWATPVGAGGARAGETPSDGNAATDGDGTTDGDWTTDGDVAPLRRLARSFGLDPLDIELLLVALAPDVDPRFERLYGYLNDDVTRRRASVALALRLCGARLDDGGARARLGPTGPLIRGALIELEDPDRPFLGRALRVPDRVVTHLLGDPTREEIVTSVLDDAAVARGVDDPTWATADDVDPLVRALEAGSNLTYVPEHSGTSALDLVSGAAARLNRPVLAIDFTRLAADEDARRVVRAVSRESRLTGAVLLCGPVEALVERDRVAMRHLADAPGPIIMRGRASWDPAWSNAPPVVIPAPAGALAQRRAAWQAALPTGDVDVEVTAAFRLTPSQVARAARAAVQQATAAGRPVTADDLLGGARSQNAAGLERLARRVSPRYRWTDLVLPAAVEEQLRELVSRVRHRQVVLDDWDMASIASRGRGVTALFAGDSGTGKTMSAEVIAEDLGLDMYVIDLATVVDKYIGETEKNLDRIFDEADRVNGVLLFDEADAIFGKRSEVKDARDRYANTEIAYLLQRMERFEGIAILTTNMRSNLDDAFLRRLDALVEFPVPDIEDRLRLWERCMRVGMPKTDDIDLPFLARAFELSGGNIRNVALAAAYLAAAAGRPVDMADLVRATGREYRKLGRLCVPAEFGPYHALLSSVSVGPRGPGR